MIAVARRSAVYADTGAIPVSTTVRNRPASRLAVTSASAPEPSRMFSPAIGLPATKSTELLSP
jgi:hypothetical protein